MLSHNAYTLDPAMKLTTYIITLFASLLLSYQTAASEWLYSSDIHEKWLPDSVFLERNINSPGRVLGKSILILIPSATVTPALPPTTHPAARFADLITDQIRTPVRTLLKGEYRAGADPFSRGTVYQADWSDKGVKLGIKYQF